MKILLLKDVRKVGQKGQIVEVAEGYGRNFLIKTGAGKLATASILKNQEKNLDQKEKSREEKIKKELELLGQINKKTFILKAKVSEKGHLFGAIHKKDIAEVVGVPEEAISLDKDIKEVGEHNLNVRLGGKKGKVILKVEAL